MRQEIKASFKQATIKAGTATLQFEVLPSAEGFTEVMKMTGGVVMLTVETEQQELDFDAEYEAEPLPLDEEPIERPANVDAETGEIYEPIEDEAYMLAEGSN